MFGSATAAATTSATAATAAAATAAAVLVVVNGQRTARLISEDSAMQPCMPTCMPACYRASSGKIALWLYAVIVANLYTPRGMYKLNDVDSVPSP